MSFISQTTVKSVRKSKPCDGCRRMIQAGERAVRWVGTNDGFQTALYHPECRRAEIKLNDLHETHRHGDDWISLAEIGWDDWPWLIAVCPLVAVYMGVTTARFEKARDDHQRWFSRPFPSALGVGGAA